MPDARPDTFTFILLLPALKVVDDTFSVLPDISKMREFTFNDFAAATSTLKTSLLTGFKPEWTISKLLLLLSNFLKIKISLPFHQKKDPCWPQV